MHLVSNATPRASQREELARVLQVLTPVLDIIDAPVETPAPPPWCCERGWLDFLLKLDDEDLVPSERGPHSCDCARRSRKLGQSRHNRRRDLPRDVNDGGKVRKALFDVPHTEL